MYSSVIQTDLKFKNKLFESIGRGFLSKKDLDALFKEIESSFVKIYLVLKTIIKN